MEELNIRDQSSISAPNSLLPFKLTSNQIRGLTAIKPTSLNLEKNADLSLPDQPTSNTESADHGKIQLSANTESADHDPNKLGDGIESREDKPVINRQLASLISLRDAQEELKLCRPIKKLKWEGRSYSPQVEAEGEGEGEEEEEGEESACVTPTAREQRIPREILICPPPPCKRRQCKRKLSDAMSPSSSSYLNLLAGEQQHAPALMQLVVSPPDLHTFPQCIRALFFDS